ncbi:acylphosphatase-2 [Pieris rapae]|uniref:acylphosphatase-2 n=1 Tax=Pieris rapae TaxID=64459 RepID=UPI000B927D39|nr:acylphosphatase-2 [Pieris rapae]
MGAENIRLASVEFEVFGEVQGCFFTKYCKEMAEGLGIGGWVKNTRNGTIVGRIQGTTENLDKMIDWLSTKGSPESKIEKCVLSNFENVARLAFNNFSIRF